MSYYAAYQPDPRRNVTGIALVLALHVIVVYALVSGLARKVVDVVRAPIETKLIEEIKEVPPPKEVAPPPPVLDTPPPFVPPPEVTINTAPPDAGITAVASDPPPVEAPAPAPVVAPPPPPPAPVVKPVNVAVNLACPTRALPKLTPRQESVSGSIRARLTIKGSKVTDVEILSSTPKGFFDAAVRSAVLQYGCQASSDQVIVTEQTFNFVAEQ